MSYVNSSTYESETDIQKTERLIEELTSQVESLKIIHKDLLNKRNLDLLDKMGDRAVIRFTKSYNHGSSIYHYAAIKSGKWWFITSDGLEYKRTADEMKKFIGNGTVEVMSPYRSL